jgi:thioredoxin-like negative regulator of GroEL
LGLFRQAQVEYLSGNWFDAERLLTQLLGADESDADVRLMLATLYRRVRRWDAARSELALVATYDQLGKWQLEVSRERILLHQDRARQKETQHKDMLTQQNNLAGPDGHVSGAA